MKHSTPEMKENRLTLADVESSRQDINAASHLGRGLAIDFVARQATCAP
jgi:hypothetical protein